jgi:hypothetical protein
MGANWIIRARPTCLGDYLCPPIFAKRSPRKCCKRSHSVRSSKSTESSKGAAYILIAKNSINYYFNSAKVDFENMGEGSHGARHEQLYSTILRNSTIAHGKPSSMYLPMNHEHAFPILP